MLRVFQPASRITVSGVILFVTGSMFFGAAAGNAAWFFSQVIYIPVAFPVSIGFLVAVSCSILLKAGKIHHKGLSVLTGLLTALIIVLTFNLTAYQHTRSKFIQDLENNHITENWQAENALDQMLEDKTGRKGFPGYMLLTARGENIYSGYIVMYSLPIYEFNFRIKGFCFWIFTFFELLFYALPIIFLTREAPAYFNESANDWYCRQEQIALVPLSFREQLMAELDKGRLLEIGELTHKGETLSHPRFEIYSQQSRNKKGDVLLLLKETCPNSRNPLKRRPAGMWEAPRDLYQSFLRKI